jgi:hypothetical protein
VSYELRVVLVVLASWRLTHLLVEEDGPWDIVVRIRRSVGDGVLGRAMDCFYCFSLWVAAPMAWFVGHDVMTWVVAWLAIAGGACLLERATGRGPTVGDEGGRYVVLRSSASGTPSFVGPGSGDDGREAEAERVQSDAGEISR